MGKGVPESVLSSGEKIPAIGLGTGSTPLDHDHLTSTFVAAMEVGYRHFDTASVYGSEPPLGKAIAQTLQQGIVQTRQELFITSKLWCTDAHHDMVLPALRQTLKRLELEYIDLYLIHWPVTLKPGEFRYPINEEELVSMDFDKVWEAMEECQRLGLTKSIGVSNFSCKKLSLLMANAKIPPAVNQVEMNVNWQQEKLRDFCKKKGIHLSAWSPLSSYGNPWGSLAVLESPVLKQIANAKGKTTAQVALRWVVQQGVSAIVKCFNRERMKENLQIFDWELNEEEMQLISRIPQHRGFSGETFVSPTGPYKTLKELWDEEE